MDFNLQELSNSFWAAAHLAAAAPEVLGAVPSLVQQIAVAWQTVWFVGLEATLYAVCFNLGPRKKLRLTWRFLGSYK